MLAILLSNTLRAQNEEYKITIGAKKNNIIARIKNNMLFMFWFDFYQY